MPLLEYLRDVVDAPVPDDVLRRLREAPSPRFERVGFRQTSRPFRTSTPLYMIFELGRGAAGAVHSQSRFGGSPVCEPPP